MKNYAVFTGRIAGAHDSSEIKWKVPVENLLWVLPYTADVVTVFFTRPLIGDKVKVRTSSDDGVDFVIE